MIPCVPDAEVARAELRAMPLLELLGVYVNWVQRFIPPRPREVRIVPKFWESRFTQECGGEGLALADKIAKGAGLTPHLSNKVHTDGYAPMHLNTRGRTHPRGPEWGDKDFALNAFGVHHLHLAPTNGKPRRSERGYLLYAAFGRSTAALVYLG